MGGKPGNSNALRHGACCRLPLGRAHPMLEPARKRVAKFRALIEAECVETRGEIRTPDACSIHAACTHQMLIELWSRRLKRDLDALPLEQLLAISATISREVDRRDAAIARLGIGKATAATTLGAYTDYLRGESTMADAESSESTMADNHNPSTMADSGEASA
jgi:hypothetical protein